MGNGRSCDDRKAFIDDAYGRGISVIADMVLNHLGAVDDSGPPGRHASATENIHIGGEAADTQAGGNFGKAPDRARWEAQNYIEGAFRYYLEAPFRRPALRLHVADRQQERRVGRRQRRRGAAPARPKPQGHAPDRVLTCKHWDVRDNRYNPWMAGHVGFDAGDHPP